ncbi:ATPase [Aquimarina addita]|uniref:ATPase n=1 Tax=Aquimarina addita TaxID=870485 RepID=A0ABP7XAK0_9FLAO
MDSFELIKSKLEEFIKRYYVNELIKGVILFFTIGVLYFLVTVLIEYVMWLSIGARTILFWLFIIVEFSLFIKFIVIPVAGLLRLTKGIDYKEASLIIGKHFADVNDKLLNLLQLRENEESSSLLIASIEQKSEELKPVPFKLAIDFKENQKYLKYAIIPILIFIVVSFFGNKNWFSEGYGRVVNYEVAYEPPAPFQFFIINDELTALENKDFVIEVKTTGDVVPENVTVSYNDEIYFLKNTGVGSFQYTFTKPKESINFILSSNDVNSKEYELEVVPVPTLLDFEMFLDYPSYTGKKDEVLKSSGNGIIPEGTKVSWNVHARNTDEVHMKTMDSLYVFENKEGNFQYKKGLYNDWDYEITTSNTNVKDYDNLSFSINVVKDQYPELNITSKMDSIDNSSLYFYGRVSDDYGLRKLRMVYYDVDNNEDKIYKNIQVNPSVFSEFVSVFPGDLSLTKGVDYEFYFEVFDNDVIHNYKSTRSQVFNFRQLTKGEEEDKRLKEQNESISGLNKSLKKFKEQQEDLQALSKIQKEKKRLNFNDKKKLQEYLKRQKEEEKVMKNFAKKLKENLNDLEKKEEPFKDALKEMMERNEEKLKKNEKLLEEINEMMEKMQKEELTEKLEELSKENKNVKKNLEQLLELTKRLYVIEKHEKLSDKLLDLAEQQEKLSDKNEKDNTKEAQEKLNEEFEKFQKEMDGLRKENESLKKPMNLDQKEEDEKDIEKEQQKATDNLEKKEQSEAKKNQKSAAQKMKEMSKGMQMEMGMSGEAQQQEDMDMLRQILDNLVDFSLEQEDLMKQFKGIDVDNPAYSGKLKRQSVLRENFIHIDDSLYALALRTPKISDKVTTKLTDIEFNLDKSLERLAENQVVFGSTNQQYVVTGSNDLAYFLSKVLEQMQNSMPSSGKGKGDSKGFQLPDIIKKQEELNEKMKEGSEKGKGEKEEQGKQSGNNPGDNEGGKQGGKSGKEGKEGKEGEGNQGKGQGKNGKNGKGEVEGKDGNNGESELQKENMNGELFEIYKQQQQLRNALEEKLSKEGKGRKSGSNILRRMEQVEQELLDKGFNQNTLSKMLELKHELLKMEDATFEQGEEERRESKTNKNSFDNETIDPLGKAKQYFNTTEILNRQVLPLRQNYKRRVQDYFKKSND